MRNRVLFLLALTAVLCGRAWGELLETDEPASVLVVVEGSTSLKSQAIARGRQLATLLGHFNARTRVLGVNEYVPHTFSRYNLVVFIGFNANYTPPARFQEDVLASRVPVI